MGDPHWHTYDCRVRWSDVDAYGHVNNVAYLEYFQEARISFWATVAPHGGFGSLVVARLVVDYKLPIFFRAEPYPIFSRVLDRGRSSFELYSELGDGARVLSTARSVLVAYDASAQGSRPLSEQERTFLDDLAG